MAHESMDILRQTVKNAIAHSYRAGDCYRIEIDGQPEDFAIISKQITYAPFEFDLETVNVGMLALSYPKARNAANITTLLKDYSDCRVEKWLADWASNVGREDGTMNFPSQFLKLMTIWDTKEGDKIIFRSRVFPVSVAEVTLSYETGTFELSATFAPYKSTATMKGWMS